MPDDFACRPSDDGEPVDTVLSPGAVLHVTGMDPSPSPSWLKVDLGGATAWLKREVSNDICKLPISLSISVLMVLSMAAGALARSGASGTPPARPVCQAQRASSWLLAASEEWP